MRAWEWRWELNWGDWWSSTPMIFRMLKLMSWRAIETSNTTARRVLPTIPEYVSTTPGAAGQRQCLQIASCKYLSMYIGLFLSLSFP